MSPLCEVTPVPPGQLAFANYESPNLGESLTLMSHSALNSLAKTK